MKSRSGDPWLLVEEATTAHRERDSAGRILPSPAWQDLSPEDRERLFEHQLLSRWLEQLVDPRGLSTTARELLARIRGLGQR